MNKICLSCGGGGGPGAGVPLLRVLIGPGGGRDEIWVRRARPGAPRPPRPPPPRAPHPDSRRAGEPGPAPSPPTPATRATMAPALVSSLLPGRAALFGGRAPRAPQQVRCPPPPARPRPALRCLSYPAAARYAAWAPAGVRTGNGAERGRAQMKGLRGG